MPYIVKFKTRFKEKKVFGFDSKKEAIAFAAEATTKYACTLINIIEISEEAKHEYLNNSKKKTSPNG